MSAPKVVRHGAARASEAQDEVLSLRRSVERNPYGVLAAAVGVGFVLGGGLFTRLAARLVGTGLRLGLVAAMPRLQEELLRGASQWLGQTNASSENGKQ
jgi:hypothetical protein